MADVLDAILTERATSWRQQAACRGMVGLFYPSGYTGWPALRQIEQAKSICASCPVTEECLADSDGEGIWGGLKPAERGHGRGVGARRIRNALRVGCGTEAAYQWHLRAGETPCDACRAANAAGKRLRRTGYRRPAPPPAPVAADVDRQIDQAIEAAGWDPAPPPPPLAPYLRQALAVAARHDRVALRARTDPAAGVISRRAGRALRDDGLIERDQTIPLTGACWSLTPAGRDLAGRLS